MDGFWQSFSSVKATAVKQQIKKKLSKVRVASLYVYDEPLTENDKNDLLSRCTRTHTDWDLGYTVLLHAVDLKLLMSHNFNL